jgi:hypothetical protein
VYIFETAWITEYRSRKVWWQVDLQVVIFFREGNCFGLDSERVGRKVSKRRTCFFNKNDVPVPIPWHTDPSTQGRPEPQLEREREQRRIQVYRFCTSNKTREKETWIILPIQLTQQASSQAKGRASRSCSWTWQKSRSTGDSSCDGMSPRQSSPFAPEIISANNFDERTESRDSRVYKHALLHQLYFRTTQWGCSRTHARGHDASWEHSCM